jgi:large subunit ribosomal protein L9
VERPCQAQDQGRRKKYSNHDAVSLKEFFTKLPLSEQCRRHRGKKNFLELIFVRTLTDNACAAFIRIRARENLNMPTTEVILTDNVPGLGAEADVVKVRRGYARNYLLPEGKAYEVTPAALRQLDNLKKKRAEREARELNEAEELSRKIGKARLVFTLATGESGKAFGSVTTQDIANRMKNELGIEIDRHKIALERPIKDTGEHEVAIKLHHDVTAQFKFDVKSAEVRKTDEPAGEHPEKKRRGFFRRHREERKEE